VLKVLEALNGVRCVLCTLEAVEGELCLLEVPEVMRCVLLCMLEAVEGGMCLPGGVGGVGGNVLCALCLEAVEGGLSVGIAIAIAGVFSLQSATEQLSFNSHLDLDLSLNYKLSETIRCRDETTYY
jgi:hypothetical protein